MNIFRAMIDQMLNPFHLNTGVTNGKFKELPQTPNCVSTQTLQSEKLVAPIPFCGTREESKQKIKDALLELPDDIRPVEERDDYLYVIFVSKGMKFKDDVEFYFDDVKKQIEFRSCSRIGFSDMGVNRKRYDAIKEIYCK
ncbi:MAG: DUF1499 domain-containing protein [Clostridiales bacterium]|nr:DUF1499 domain-containing protein [Clostridiales bacterium]